MRFVKTAVLLGLVLSSAATFTPRACALEPDEVAVLFAEGNEESRELARHYAKARGIPELDNVFSVEVPSGDELDRSVWEGEVRPAILQWLESNDPDRKLRCIVTCRGIPLKIGKRDASSPVVAARRNFLTESRRRRIAKANELVTLYEEMIGRKVTRSGPLASTATSKQLSDRLEGVISFTQQYLQTLGSQSEKQKVIGAYERFLTVAGGIDAAAKMISGGLTEETLQRLAPQQAIQIGALAGRAQGLAQGLAALNNLPDSVARDVQLLNLTETARGLVGTVMWIDEERDKLRDNQTESSFDSELSLVYWPDHPLFGWYPNILYFMYDTAGVDKSRQMMVSRLTGPTLEIAKAMVDSAVAAEREGLKGKVYLDARGLAADAADQEDGPILGQFDQSLRDLAARLKKTGSIEVVLDDGDGVFQNGSCADVALYCGWLGRDGYVDAFTWNPGAVGYHLSKDSAATLTSAGGTNWCNAMIERGVAGTLGPVYASNLQAFPLPDIFFSTLLTGEYTLVETYYRTKPFNSWMMVLVGDPLYNPFKKKPLLTKDQLPDVLDPAKREAAAAAANAGQAGAAPSQQPAPQNENAVPAADVEIEGAGPTPGTEAEKEGAKEENEEEFKFTLPGLDEDEDDEKEKEK